MDQGSRLAKVVRRVSDMDTYEVRLMKGVLLLHRAWKHRETIYNLLVVSIFGSVVSVLEDFPPLLISIWMGLAIFLAIVAVIAIILFWPRDGGHR